MMETAAPQEGARRPLIGLMTGSFHTDYSKQIAEAICRRLHENGMDVCLFQGLDASRFLNVSGYVDKSFDSHYYSQFEYSRFLRPDLLVVSFSTISAVPDPLPLKAFRELLPDVPMIVLEAETDLPRSTAILLDNYQGMSDCVEHLIRAHGCRKIVYLGGPKNVADAELRLSAYRDAMERHGLPVTEDMIAYGDFTDQVDALVERLLAACPQPDAIVCANDEMAESTYRVLYGRWIRPGIDVAVTGFDDNPSASMMDPPLTTVLQSKDAIAEKVLEVIRASLRGEIPPSVTLPAQLVVRTSCGCPAPKREGPQPPVEAIPQAIVDRQTIKRLFHESMLTSLLLRNLLDQRISVYSFFQRLGEMLRLLGAKRSWIALLDRPITVTENGRPRLPDQLRLHMHQSGDAVLAWSDKDAPFLTESDPALVSSLRSPEFTGEQDAVFPLFHGGYHYGVFVVQLPLEDMLFYYTISLQIGTGLRYLFMALKEQEARAALEEKNQILDFSASHDILTGLYNRVGVINSIYEFIRIYGQKARYVAVMADLDHLKQINDTFGHSMGDHAIRQAAEILSSALPKGTPIGRSGGDEFMAIFVADGDDAPERFRRRVKEACKAYNDLGETPFYEEISVGCYLFEWSTVSEISAYFNKADERLYEDKKQRRASVLRLGPQ